MSAQHITTSAAVYFNAARGERVDVAFLERARGFFANFNLSPILFTASGDGFVLDDCHLLAEPGQDSAFWGETIRARRTELVEALHNGAIEDLFLDSPRPSAGDREDWRAKVAVSLVSGELYLGVDASLAPDPAILLRRAYDFANGIFDIRYGIAYKSPLAEHPDCYASGIARVTTSDALQIIRHRREWEQRKQSPDELWHNELRDKRRHLTGLFRGAYPASILSVEHVRKADLQSHGIGRLSQVNPTCWLWELSDQEISAARKALDDASALVR